MCVCVRERKRDTYPWCQGEGIHSGAGSWLPPVSAFSGDAWSLWLIVMCCVPPRLATPSGDGTVMWDYSKTLCLNTLTDHQQPGTHASAFIITSKQFMHRKFPSLCARQKVLTVNSIRKYGRIDQHTIILYNQTAQCFDKLQYTSNGDNIQKNIRGSINTVPDFSYISYNVRYG